MKTPSAHTKNSKNSSKIGSPRALLILTIVSMFFIAAAIYGEYRARQKDYVQLLEKQASLFIQTVRHATEIALLTSTTVDADMNLGLRWIGQFLKKFQADENVEYVVLQNQFTIVAGSFADYDIAPFSQDRVLQAVLDSERPTSRILQFDNKLIYESISPFYFGDVPMGLLRLGLSMDEYQALQKSVGRRLFIFAVVLIVFGLIVINLLISHRHRRILLRDLGRLQDVTATVFDNLSSGVISVDQNGFVRSINKQALTLLAKPYDDIINSSYTLLPGDYVEVIRAKLDSGGANASVTKKWLTVSGERRLFTLQTNVLKNDDDTNSCVLIINDITDQTQLEEQLRRNQRLDAMRNLAFSVAHEIKNPLNAINLLIDLIRKKFKPTQDEEKLNKHLDTVSAEIARISTIVEQYLRFSRPTRLNLSSLSMPDVMHDISVLMSPELSQHNIQFEIDMADHPPLQADRDQLKQLFINLIKNAQDAVQQDGHISVIGRLVDIYYEVRLADDGVGIPEKNLDAVFDLYFTSKAKGNGVGLSVAQQIVEAHGGTIDVESEEGMGTTFSVRLPL